MASPGWAVHGLIAPDSKPGLASAPGGGGVPLVVVRLNVVLCEPDVAVPVTVIVNVPSGVLAEVATRMVEEPPAVTDVGLNVTVAPDGAPLAGRAPHRAGTGGTPGG